MATGEQQVAHCVRKSLLGYLAMVSGNIGEDVKGKGGCFFARMAERWV